MGSGKGKARRVQSSVTLSPTAVLDDGTKEWRDSNGELHRVDGPAVERPNGDWEWRLEGKRHRVGGPAVEYQGGDDRYWKKGRLEWYEEGVFHRLDGPAVVCLDG